MSDETESDQPEQAPEEQKPDAPSADGQKPPSAVKTLQQAVAERIAGSGDAVLERVAEHFADETIKKRVDQVKQAMTQLDNLERDLRKIKADQVAYDESGKVVHTLYSREKLEERKKLTQRIEKVQRAIDKALTKGDYGDIGGLGSGS